MASWSRWTLNALVMLTERLWFGSPCVRLSRPAGLPCHVYPDGMTVEVGDSDFESDAVLHCGAQIAG